ncbi:hypothetical protein ABK040_007545 [Willaertia magna]
MAKSKLSGIQRDVLSLYRQFLRTAKRKENPEMLKKYIRHEFNTYKDIPKNETNRIEWFLRNGYNKLEMLQNETCTSVTFFY